MSFQNSYRERSPLRRSLFCCQDAMGRTGEGSVIFFKGVSFHFEICPGIDLSCLDINVTEEIPNHIE